MKQCEHGVLLYGRHCIQCEQATVTIRSFRIVDRKIIDGESDEQISKR